MAIEIVDLPIKKMVDLSMVFCMFTRPGKPNVSVNVGTPSHHHFMGSPPPNGLHAAQGFPHCTIEHS
jgi:hypothetical protein